MHASLVSGLAAHAHARDETNTQLRDQKNPANNMDIDEYLRQFNVKTSFTDSGTYLKVVQPAPQPLTPAHVIKLVYKLRFVARQNGHYKYTMEVCLSKLLGVRAEEELDQFARLRFFHASKEQPLLTIVELGDGEVRRFLADDNLNEMIAQLLESHKYGAMDNVYAQNSNWTFIRYISMCGYVHYWD